MGIQAIKKSLRNSKRILEKGKNLDAESKLEHEKRVQALEKQLELEMQTQIEKNHMEKYKMVRFFERKKAERRYKRSQKNPSDINEIQCALTQFLYTKCHPKDRPYVSLYARKKNSEDENSADDKSTAVEVEKASIKSDNEVYEKIKNYILDCNDVPKFTTKLEAKVSYLFTKNKSVLVITDKSKKEKKTEETDDEKNNQQEDDFFL